MRISYAILTHDDGDYLRGLVAELDRLLACARYEHEIVILDDESRDAHTREVLADLGRRPDVRVGSRPLAGDYAAQRNALVALTRGEYVFHLDTDERPSSRLVTACDVFIEQTPVEAYVFPRINLVDGLDVATAQRFGRVLDAQGRLDWPDYQARLHRKAPHIAWSFPLHEQLRGQASTMYMPDEPGYALVHRKPLAKQMARWRSDPQYAHVT